MKLNYHPDTDSLYIDLSAKPSAESVEVSKGVVLDYDADGNLVGIDIDHEFETEFARTGHESHSTGNSGETLEKSPC